MFARQHDEELDDRHRPLRSEQAACRRGPQNLLELFFSEQLDDIAAAKRVCEGCAVQVPCLEGALARREPWGVWGGQLLFNGKVLAQKRKRGRPPKVRSDDSAA